MTHDHRSADPAAPHRPPAPDAEIDALDRLKIEEEARRKVIQELRAIRDRRWRRDVTRQLKQLRRDVARLRRVVPQPPAGPDAPVDPPDQDLPARPRGRKPGRCGPDVYGLLLRRGALGYAEVCSAVPHHENTVKAALKRMLAGGVVHK